MATVVVTFAFAVDAQSFVGAPGANSTTTYNAGTGNPAGSLQSSTTGKSHSNANQWTRVLTYEDLGVPAGSVITGITSASAQSRCTVFTTGASSLCGAALIDGSLTVTLSSSRNFTATDASFVTTNGVDNTTMHTPSNASITLQFFNTLVTGNSNTAVVTLLQDQLTFTITYTVLPSDTISFVSAKHAATNTNGTTNSATGTFTVSDGPNRVLIYCVGSDTLRTSDDITSITYAGTAMTLLSKLIQINEILLTYFYYMINPPSGSNAVSVTSTSNHFLDIIAAEYTGVLSVTQPDVSTIDVSAQNATTSTTTLTSIVDNDWMILLEYGLSPSGPAGAGTGSTLRASGGYPGGQSASTIFDSNGPITPPGSFSMTTTRVSTGANWPIVHHAAMLKPAGTFTPPRRPAIALVNRTVIV